MLESILLVGCGNMGGAMLAGWLASGMAPSRFTVVDPVLAEAPGGVELLRQVPGGRRFDAVLLGVKPQLLGEVAPQVVPAVGSGTLVLSILAGVELASLAARFPGAGGFVRIMPNLAAAIGKSPIALAGERLTEERRSDITALFSPLGTPEWLAGEALFDAVTALAGSGPAFVYRFIDALARAGEALGIPADQAARMALATVQGSANMAARASDSPGVLADRVASPGGMTREGMNVLDADDRLLTLMTDTLAAARDRGEAMARGA